MEKYYQPIDGKNLAFDKDSIKHVFGAAGDVIEADATYFNGKMRKFAFFNTGELCEVQIEDRSSVMFVKCHSVARCIEVLHWLKTYLVSSMKEMGWETKIQAGTGNFFTAKFYKEGEE